MQEVFGIDIEIAMAGHHSVTHIAALVAQLPLNARVNCALDDDARWTQTDVLLACIYNSLNGLIWGMGDKKKRGEPPKPIGPKYMTQRKPNTRKLDAMVMTVDELMEILSKPRGKAIG